MHSELFAVKGKGYLLSTVEFAEFLQVLCDAFVTAKEDTLSRGGGWACVTTCKHATLDEPCVTHHHLAPSKVQCSLVIILTPRLLMQTLCQIAKHLIPIRAPLSKVRKFARDVLDFSWRGER